MEYSIKEAAQMLNIPISTIRYYDKEGLLPSNAKARATARFRNATSRR